jgi:hypothetical protein
MKSSIFWDITSCRLLKSTYVSEVHIDSISRIEKAEQETSKALFVTCFDVGFLLDLYFDLNMEATYSSETSIDFQRTTWRCIPEGRTLISDVSSPAPTQDCVNFWVFFLSPDATKYVHTPFNTDNTSRETRELNQRYAPSF